MWISMFVVGVLGADLLELLRHLGVVELLAAGGVDVEQVGAHQGGLQVVGHQAADLAGLGHVGSHLGQALGIGLKRDGNHHLAGKPSSVTSMYLTLGVNIENTCARLTPGVKNTSSVTPRRPS
jgi:hypothetical protein